ncbi:helicase HerA-like domain-containing protein [Hyphobacterium sp.]|uniref:helicase HerA-like domain-containing protein n=1 Tax=Hyphobacterium sp. TaxID=2004662 RepID=UPI003BABEFF6
MGQIDRIFIGGAGGEPQHLILKRANRHGIISGATGTGKTVTLQILTEAFSKAGVPVFAADIKGDLSGLAVPGSESHKLHDKLISRANKIGLEDYAYSAPPCVFWDVFGEKGHPIRTTVSEMGPLLLSRMLELNDTQEGVLNVAFQLAEDENLLLLDLADLRALLAHVSERRAELSAAYGNVAVASIGAIQRRLLSFEREGLEHFFGEPALSLADFMTVDENGHGRVNVLDATKLIHAPNLYALFLLWLLAELFEELPEVGDPDRPRIAFFFDEAHLLFDRAPRALVNKVEQTVKLIRSKGVGVYFVTQNPRDIPDEVLSQLGNRIQHALRAYTPKERRALKAAAESFRENPAFDTQQVITELGVGEALVSTLDAKGIPQEVARTLIRPPSSRLGPLTDLERAGMMASSPLKGVYDERVDRESAFERLEERTAQRLREEESARQAEEREERRRRTTQTRSRRTNTRRRSRRMSSTERAVNNVLRESSRTLVRELVRGVLGVLRR